MVVKPDSLNERCLHCQAPEETIICSGCRSLLRQSQHSCVRCAQTLESADLVCGRCQQQPPAFDTTYTACVYEHPVDWWVHALKFNGQLAYARLMAHCLLPQLQRLDANIPLIPVPLHEHRYRQRGYNQAYEIARELSQLSGHSVLQQALVRTRDTAMQSELSGQQRQSNVRKAFQAAECIQADHVLLVDDVMTTGHTLRACAAALQQAGVEKIDVMVFARA